MATEIQPVPPVPEPPDFPSLSDRRTGTYNAKAYAWALYYATTFVQRLAAVLSNILNNATVAHERAALASAAATTADGQASLAMGYRNVASNAAGTATTQAGIATDAAGVAITARNQAVSAADQAHVDAQAVADALAGVADGPVSSVNGKTSIVVLTSADIGALPATGAIALAGSVRAPRVAVAALAIDCSTGNYFAKTVAANSTFTFTGAPAAGNAYGMSMDVTHTSGVITWPTSVKWPGDTAPTLTAGKVHKFLFTTSDGGATWRGAALSNYAS